MSNTTDEEPDKVPALFTRLQAHFQSDPARLTVLEQHYPSYHRANVQLALDELFRAADAPPELTGVVVRQEYYSVTLSKLSRPAMSADDFDEGPVEYVDVPLANDGRMSCVKRGIYQWKNQGRPSVVLVTEDRHGASESVVVEVMTTTKEEAEAFAQRISRLVNHGQAFRGKVLSLATNCYGSTTIQFHKLPQVLREQVILPEALLNRIERHTVGFSTQSARLLAAGRHLKRGILLHGPPGTGKTFTAMYLAARMPGRTIFLVTGGGVASIEQACQMARLLAPATIILEDVDLIGTERSGQSVGANAILFQLLNQMDGLAEDVDVLFLLTTNRPDVLEPALAARPGRIDQALEVPLPDLDCRRRIFQLYSQGLTLQVERLESLINRMEGVSAAFIREILRKGAVIAALDCQDQLIVTDEHLDEALGELLIQGGPLTQSLLGGARTIETDVLH